MATFMLVAGAGEAGRSWHLISDELRARGHDAVAIDLPASDDAAGLGEYAGGVGLPPGA